MMKRFLSLILSMMLLFSAALPACADGEKYVENPHLNELMSLILFINTLGMQEGASFDVAGATGKIMYYPWETRKGYTGQEVADGGIPSNQNTFYLNMGAGVSNEDLWYLNYDFTTDKTSIESILYNTQFLLLAISQLGFDMGEGEEGTELRYQLLEALLGGRSIAFERGGMVLFAKYPSEGRILIGVNSLAFYNEFYAGTIADYYVFE